MSRAQRVTFLGIAVLIAVVAVIVFTAGGGDDPPPEGEQSAATATATPTGTPTEQPEASPQETPTPTPEPTPEPPPLLTSGGVTELEVTEGERVRFRVRSSTPEEIHVHGYDIVREIPPDETVNVSFPADLTGIWEIEFHNSGTPIAELRVEPR
jgi:FtsP/CotA-like multicopper oxidase with cupredoxin domain